MVCCSPNGIFKMKTWWKRHEHSWTEHGWGKRWADCFFMMFFLSTWMVKVKQKKHGLRTTVPGTTPLKINMEHYHGGLVQIIILFSNGWFVGSMLIFQGVPGGLSVGVFFDLGSFSHWKHVKVFPCDPRGRSATGNFMTQLKSPKKRPCVIGEFPPPKKQHIYYIYT